MEKEKQKNGFYCYILGLGVKILLRLFFGLRIRKDRASRWLKFKKKGCVILCAHPSEFDGALLLSAVHPRRTRFVVGAQQLYKGRQGRILSKFDVIPKKQFAPDISAVREMIETVKNRQVLAMMPEGRVSPDGTASPVDFSAAKLIKKLGASTAVLIPHGTYFVKPPYRWNRIFRGRVSADMKLLATDKEIEKLTAEEIYERLRTLMSYDACEDLRDTGAAYGKDKDTCMQGVSNLFYRCPSCGALHSITDDGHALRCSRCGLEAKLSPNTFIEGPEGIPDTVSGWNGTQLDYERAFWKNENAVLGLTVRKHTLDLSSKDRNFRQTGTGYLSLDHQGLYYRDDEETLDVPLALLPGISTDYMNGYLTYYEGDLVRRFSVTDKRDAISFVNSLVVLRELHGL